MVYMQLVVVECGQVISRQPIAFQPNGAVRGSLAELVALLYG